MDVIKRNGTIVPFDKDKIEVAILKAMKVSVMDEKVAKEIADEIEVELHKEFGEFYEVSIYTIEAVVFDKLIEKGMSLTAKKYEGYRSIQEYKRLHNTTDSSISSLLKLTNHDVATANSNKNAVMFSTQRDLIAGEVSKDMSTRVLLPSDVLQGHNDAILHFHDLDYHMHEGMTNCCLANIEDMLDNGTAMNGIKVDSPTKFSTACTVMTQIMACIASNQYGGQSVNIKYLGKYLRKTYTKEFEHYRNLGYSLNEAVKLAEDRMFLDLKDGIQTVQYQINTLTTTNGQSPFVTLFLHLEEGYEYEREVALIIEEIIKQRIVGIKDKSGKYVTPTFPKLVYVLDEHNCLKGGKYDYLTKLACSCSAKRMYPDYISAKKMREHYDGNVFSCMGCRSFLSPWFDMDGNVKFDGRLNGGVVSLNLPQIGIIANKNMDEFWRLLESRLQLCYKALMYRHSTLKDTLSDVSPIHWQDGAIARLKSGETINQFLNNGYLTMSLGYIGLYELSVLMLGESHTSPKGKEFALEVMRYMKNAVIGWKKETGIGFALYGTPSESLCYRFAKADLEQFGVIKDITDKGYYTNSYHVDVREKIDAFEKLKFEEEFQIISSGGCISYVEIPNTLKNITVIEEIVKFIYDNIQYAEFNTKSDDCFICSYDGEMIINDANQFECPNCGNTNRNLMYVTRRTCGYLGSNFWNDGKMKEFKLRYVHVGEEEEEKEVECNELFENNQE